MGKVLYGIRKAYVAVLTESDNVITYGTPFAVEGVTGFSPEPQGENVVFYADDKIYFRKEQNNGYQGDLTLAVTPEKFLTDILGRLKDSNDVVIENSDTQTARFALMFEAEGDPKNRRFVYWDCTAGRPSREFATTEDSIEVGTESIQITIAPRSTDNAVGGYIEKNDDNAEVYDGWFSEVYESSISL